jgi:hypothetical protein
VNTEGNRDDSVEKNEERYFQEKVIHFIEDTLKNITPSYIFNRVIFFYFLRTLFNTASSAANSDSTVSENVGIEPKYHSLNFKKLRSHETFPWTLGMQVERRGVS